MGDVGGTVSDAGTCAEDENDERAGDATDREVWQGEIEGAVIPSGNTKTP